MLNLFGWVSTDGYFAAIHTGCQLPRVKPYTKLDQPLLTS